MLRFRTAASILQASPQHTCHYHNYTWPSLHSGLPLLGDAFVSADHRYVNFIGVNRGSCFEKYAKSDQFFAENRQGHRFVCVFPDQTMVLSDTIHPTTIHYQAFVIRCLIPAKYQNIQPTEYTDVAVRLHAIEDLDQEPEGKEQVRYYPSISITDTPYLEIPLCHHLWPAYNNTFIPERPHRLSIFTRLKSVYADESQQHAQQHQMDETAHLKEWIAYHRELGVEHFYVYDNDPIRHGRLETIFHDYINRGILTYAWFPMEDCTVDYGGWKGYGSARGQFAAGLSMLHRYGHYNDYMAHIDVDEYLVPLNNTSLLPILEKHAEFDVLAFRPYWMTACNQSTVHPTMMKMEKYNCFTGNHYADYKLIMKPSKVLYFMVHYPIVNFERKEPKTLYLNDQSDGLLAHYRQKDTMPYSLDQYEGVVTNEYTTEMNFMEPFVNKVKYRLAAEIK